jgi:hypothetical protein
MKTPIQQRFHEFAEKHDLNLNIAEANEKMRTWYGTLSGANRALKVLQAIMGGTLHKGGRVLETHTTEYVVECLDGRYLIAERVKSRYIAARVKTSLGILDF